MSGQRPAGHYQDASERHWLHQVYDGSAYGAPERDVDQWVDWRGEVADPPEYLERLVPVLPSQIEEDVEKVRRHAAWWVSPSAKSTEEPGGFVRALLEAITRADSENVERLRAAFPVYVHEVLVLTRGEVDL